MNVDRIRNKTGNRVNLIVPIIALISVDKAFANATKWRMWIKDSLSVIPRTIKRRDQPSSRLWPADCEWLWTTLQTHRQHLRVIIINHLCLAATRGRPPSPAVSNPHLFPSPAVVLEPTSRHCATKQRTRFVRKILTVGLPLLLMRNKSLSQNITKYQIFEMVGKKFL